ncbi:hypothetical protein B0J12DRAFT_660307 [Macrophomina phaseolina]|uniref:Uncharacterized protein n=1 Tax=Macrophomina phaseolina TaxID=35725 RepID=A0ABQ8GCG7_9PEZI|nr:hypothetical protein B0J12DRAFT_660307 [Macrophomina phaseolina]
MWDSPKSGLFPANYFVGSRCEEAYMLLTSTRIPDVATQHNEKQRLRGRRRSHSLGGNAFPLVANPLRPDVPILTSANAAAPVLPARVFDQNSPPPPSTARIAIRLAPRQPTRSPPPSFPSSSPSPQKPSPPQQHRHLTPPAACFLDNPTVCAALRDIGKSVDTSAANAQRSLSTLLQSPLSRGSASPPKSRRWISAHPLQTIFYVVSGVVFITPGLVTGPLLGAAGFGASGPVAGKCMEAGAEKAF